MRNRRLLLGAAAALAALQLSCAAGVGLTPLRESEPAARAGLRPEYRLFYDALGDYGDWILIEPYGYVFRPVVNPLVFRPYQDGFWVPSDVYGWVWISAEPFGWATYHYGQWLFDRFQGWVWIPGIEWAPAWVSWEYTDDYIGWAPRLAPGSAPGAIPGGPFVWVPMGELPATDLKTRVRTAPQLAERLGAPKPIENLAERDGVRFNRGPELGLIERAAGPLSRVKIEDVVPPSPPGLRAPREPAPGIGAREPARPPDLIEQTRRAAEEAARAARALAATKSPAPATLPVIRPVGPAPSRPAPKREPPAGKSAPADSTK
ncbi:MAG: hypothetical protein HZC42_11165 [Candidatus Eisenbacteria bacterium]|nr:hypothetical protein [Candidatus Eisenbacteria bacterium]